MPDADPQPMIQILLTTAVVLLGVLALLGWRISRRLAHIERKLENTPLRDHADASPLSSAETAAGGAFETFLNEDPARRLLPKAEQFAAYRKWRQEKGLNWSGS